MDVAYDADPTCYAARPLSMGCEEGERPALLAGSPLKQVSACSHEDITRLAQILGDLPYTAVLRAADGTVLQLPVAHSVSSERCLKGASAFSAPIYDAGGDVLAFLELTASDSNPAGTLKRLLRMLVDSAAQAIAERLFRICYRRHWIIAARCSDSPGTSILIAVDSQQRLIGADRQARHILELDGQLPAFGLTLSAFFQIGANPFLGQRYRDIALNLRGSNDQLRWSALITPPDRSSARSHLGERGLLHARPRLDIITMWLENMAPETQGKRGLPPRTLRRIQEYIDAHLDSALTTEELAAHLQLSVSHFSRSFTKSLGLTPHNYVMRRRLARAQELLVHTQLSLVEIALRTGFCDQSHFCRRFQLHSGLAPSAFRVQLRELGAPA